MEYNVAKLEKYLDEATSLGAEYCSVRVQETWDTSFSIREGRVCDPVSGGKHGASIVVLAGGAFGMASGSPRRLGDLPKRAFKSALLSQKLRRDRLSLADVKSKSTRVELKPEKELDFEDAVKLVAEAEKAGRTAGGDSVEVGCNHTMRQQILFTSEGIVVETALPYTWFKAQVDVVEGGRGSYSDRLGHVGGYDILDKYDLEGMVVEAAEIAKESAKVKKSVSGKLPVVVSGGVSSVLAHESLGHMVEADGVMSGSRLKGKIGKKIASQHVTIIDDGLQREGFGFSPVDDEGVQGRKTVLVEDGVLKSYLHSRSTAHHFSAEPTGNARALYVEDFPIVRMTNTYFEVGDLSFEELLETMKDGLFLKGVKGGGQANSQTGEFTFGIMEGFQVLKGEIEGRVRTGSIAGNILDALRRVEGAENRCSDPLKNVGMCGKGIQRMPVGTGNPSLFLSEVLVGGG